MLELGEGHEGMNPSMNYVCSYQLNKVRRGRGNTGEENMMILEKRK